MTILNWNIAQIYHILPLDIFARVPRGSTQFPVFYMLLVSSSMQRLYILLITYYYSCLYILFII